MDLNTYLSELEYLVNLDSCSDDPEGLIQVADFFADRFREMGWIVTEHDLRPDSGKLLLCANRETAHYDVMLVGHLDTVFPRGTCAQRPFRIEGEKAYGPGVCDMKHGCLLMYHLMKELPRDIFEKLNILVVFNPDEEIGSRYSKELYLPYAEKTDYCFLYEAKAVSGNYCVERKGAVQLTVDFKGIAGHCGFVFENGAKSAISEMARWIVALDQLQSRERNTSVNVGLASGGTKSNVVPDHAQLVADIRFTDPDEVARIDAAVKALQTQAAENGIGVEIRRRGKLPLVRTERVDAYVRRLEELGQKNGIAVKFKARGGLSDANIIAQAGPVCVDGLGPAGSGGHSEKEYMVLSSVEEEFRFSNLMLRDLAENK